jgi:sugar phosphate isomerase/epimerase
MRRSDFLQLLAAGLVVPRLPRQATPAGAPLRIGLELYSVRQAMRADPEATLAAIGAMGYQEVELLWSFGNFGRTTAQVRSSLASAGLRAPTAHISPSLLLNDWEASLATAHELGHEYLIVPSLPTESSKTLDGWREWADRFNRAGAAARSAGLWLAFHNEPAHQKPIDGQIPYDLFLERTEPSLVRLQLDVGNMTMGGGDPMVYLKRHAKRYWGFHLKDVVADRSRDTELGTGTVKLRELIAAISDRAHKPCFVEQEGSSDPMASAKRNFDYLKALKG